MSAPKWRFADGTTSNMWLRTTLTFQNVNGHSLIVHEHGSEPFDIKAMKAIQQRDSH